MIKQKHNLRRIKPLQEGDMSASDCILNPRRCCLMVIDPQERLMKAIHKADKVVKNTTLMIHCCRTFGIPILATTQYLKGLGPFVPEIADLLSDVPAIDKVEFNAFANPKIRGFLKGLSPCIDTLLITGVETHICIYQTAAGALNNGYRPWVVADAVSSRDKRNKKYGLSRLTTMGITVGPAEMAIYELLGKAGTAEFKTMLPHFK